ncbi:MAG: ABC transporter ATP-binding protein [Oscillospiraceae bacterium]|nr:ABC transporter ATP-binding protein [Oscillospiraceae bacterium]
MKKFRHTISNHWMMVKLYFRFAPAYFLGNLLFCVFVSFQDTLSGPVTLQYILNGITQGKDFKEIIIFMMFVSLIIILRNTFGAYFAEYLGAQAKVKVRAGMQKIIFEHAHKMDLEYYETPKFYTDFVWAATQSDEKLWEMYRSWTVLVARLSEAMFVGGFMALTDKTLFIFAVIAIAARLVTSRLRVKKRYKMDLEIKPIERERDYMTRVFYLSDYAKEIRLSDMHVTLFSRLRDTMNRIKSIWKKDGKVLTAYQLAGNLFSDGLLNFAMYLYLCYQTMVTRTLGFGDLAGLIAATDSFTWVMRQGIDACIEMSKQSLYVDNFREFLAYRPKIEKQPGENPPEGIGEITLKNVSFKYHGEEQYSLKNINITLKPYEKIAIVGYNGAGKSTLAKLLLRLYDVTEGEILLDGKNIKQFATDKYRAQFGSVFQDYKVFAGTIGENVEMDYVKDGAEARIIKSLDESGFSEKLASLKDGINTQVTREFSEDGVNLSGGEEQKLAIARIFSRNCHYVILDEPSSALDPISEYKLNETMLHLSEKKTVIFISHRLSTTCMADRIFMLEDGEIIEEGSHETLMEMNGKYAEMFNKQAEKYRV